MIGLMAHAQRPVEEELGPIQEQKKYLHSTGVMHVKDLRLDLKPVMIIHVEVTKTFITI